MLRDRERTLRRVPHAAVHRNSLTKVDWFFEAVPLASAICSTCHSAGTSKAGRSLSGGHRQRLSRNDGTNRW
jgi:ABC-type transport system involved in cytochrome bd biosynthesis fused ATPase/permease subunit